MGMVRSAKGKNELPLNLPILLVSLPFGILSFLLPIYGKRVDAGAFEIGWLFSIFSITILVVRPIVGKAIDRYGRRKFFIASLFFYSASLVFFAFASTMTLLYIARFFQGIGSSLMWISAYAIAADMVGEENRGQVYGRIDESNAKGALFGAFFGFYFLAEFPFEQGWFYLFLIYAFIAAFAGYIAIKDVPESLSIVKDNNKQETNIESLSSKSKKKEKISPFIYRIMIIVFIASLSASMLSPLLLIFLQDKFTTDIGLLAMAFIPAAVIHSFLPSKTGKFSDRFGRVYLIAIGFLISGLISFFMPNIPSLQLLAILWVIEAVGMVMAMPALNALVADVTGSSIRGTGFGMYTFAASLGAVFGPLLGGWLYDNINHAVPFYLNGIILIVTSGLTLVLLRKNFGINENKLEQTIT